MAKEPDTKRVIIFVDGQNLFHSAKEAFGHKYPNYDIYKLSQLICDRNNWSFLRTHFYSGIPSVDDNPSWNKFWSAKLSAMGRQGVKIFSRPLQYRNQTISLPSGNTHTFLVGQEKGVDIRIALDVIQAVHRKECEIVLILSQDQDLSEVADEVRVLAKEQNRWVKIASAFPSSPTVRNKRGINNTDWIRIDREMYDNCLDATDYRQK